MTDPQMPGTGPQQDPAVYEANDELDEAEELLGLSDVIEPGDFTITVESNVAGGELTPYEVSFSWDGATHANWIQDIGVSPGHSPASSAPVYGWASWLNGDDVVLAYYSYDIEIEGCVRIPGAAPGRPQKDSDAATASPRAWLEFARTIVEEIYEPGGERYSRW
jgi:hypothetical protein